MNPARTDHSPPAPHGRLLLLVGAIVFMACAVRFGSGIVLMDDGFFVKILDGRFNSLQDPERFTYNIFRYPTATLVPYTKDLAVLSSVYSASFAFVPIIAVACVAWGMRRRRLDATFVAVAAVCLMSLPMQLDLTSHHILLSQIYWIFLICLVNRDIGRVYRWGVPTLMGALFFLHPFVTPMFIGTGLCLIAIALGVEGRRRLLTLGSVILATGVVRLAFIFMYGRERTRLTWTEHPAHEMFWRTFSSPVVGIVTAYFVLVLAAALVLLWPRFRRGWYSTICLVGVTASLLMLLLHDPRSLVYATDYVYWLAVLSVPLQATFLFLELGDRSESGDGIGIQSAILMASLLFVGGVSFVCWTFTTELSHARLKANSSPAACVQTTELFAGRPSFLDHWWFPATYLATEPTRWPAKVVTSFPNYCETFCIASSGEWQFFRFDRLRGDLGPRAAEAASRGTCAAKVDDMIHLW